MENLPRYVEIETSRFCNRVCSWCPNSVFLDRRAQDLMRWEDFEAALTSLAKHEYEGWLAFHNYNEPLANPRLLSEIRFAVRILPKALPAIYTNGDRLTEALFVRLVAGGIKQMRITVYPSAKEAGSPGHERLWDWLRRRPYLECLEWDQSYAKASAALSHRGTLDIIIINPQTDAYYDRGGTIAWLSRPGRTNPCHLTSHSLSVDYAGNAKMCCNVVSANDAHQPYILGNIREADLIELWNAPRFVALREKHRAADWSLSPICETCTQEIATS